MPYDVGETLKKCRNNAKMSVKQISETLTQKGFKASESTIYSWENGNSQPTPGALLAMCKEYGISDVLTTFGYDGYNEDGSIQLNINEIYLIEKYRALDSHGKEMVDFTLLKEWERSIASGSESKVVSIDTATDPLESTSNDNIEIQHIDEMREVQDRRFRNYAEQFNSMLEKGNSSGMEAKEEDEYNINAAHADDYANAPAELKQQEEDIMDSDKF